MFSNSAMRMAAALQAMSQTRLKRRFFPREDISRPGR
jgi:hypothetical protein